MGLANSYTRVAHRSTLAPLILGFLISTQSWAIDAVSIPTPSGPYHVGVMRHAIPHYNDHDVLAPNNISTAFLATIFYPTRHAPEDKPKPYLNPETAAFYESSYNYTTGVLASLTSNLQDNAPFLSRDANGDNSFPTILYGPGGAGPPTEGSTILLSELASYGYTVVGLDHPFEQPFLRFPNGTGVFGVDFDFNNVDLVSALYQTRLVDNAAFLRYFPALVRKLDAPFNMNLFGLLGYSFGGGAALGSILEEEGGYAFNLAAGLNLDGPLWGRLAGNSSDVDLHRPILLLGEEQLIPPAWSSFSRWQTGSYFRKILINGSLHHDFSDDTFWKTVEPGVDLSVGTIDGLRQINVTNTLVKAFFDYTLLGNQEAEVLCRPSTEWPELTYYYKNGSVVDSTC